MEEFLQQLEARRVKLIRDHETLLAAHELNLAAIDRLIVLERSGAEASKSMTEAHPFVHPKPGVKRGISPESLAGQILAVLDSTPVCDWTSAQIWEALRGKEPPEGGYRLSDNELKARNSISATLGQLWRTGRIVQISPSNGVVPAVYRIKNPATRQEEVALTEAS
jgi:hypothetical protein